MKKHGRQSLRTKMLTFNCCITLAALLLCGVVLIVSVRLLVGKYISRDIDFFLTETSHNLTSKTEYLEDFIYRIRASSQIMDCLGDKVPGEGISAQQGTFEKLADINDSKNTGGKSEPIVDKVYLFDRDGEFLRASYYAMLYSDVEKSNKNFQAVYTQFQKDKVGNKELVRCYEGETDRTYLAYTLYDHNMRETGTLIFELRLDTIRLTMKDMDNYEDAVWLLYETAGKPIFEEESEINAKTLDQIRSSYQYKPYTGELNGRSYRIYYEDMSLGLSVVLAVPRDQAAVLLNDSIKLYLIIIAFIMVVTTVAFVMVIYYLTKPLQEVSGKLMAVKEGDFETKLPDYNTQEFHEISHTFNGMTAYINHLVNQVYEKQLSIKELEIKFLQMQMNPHFMFNVINMIALQAKMNEDEEVYKMITSFAQLIQAKIYRKDTEKVKICQELEYVEYYLCLQQYRFGEHLDYSVEVTEEELKECYIPKLCLQLIVENAVIHGIEPLLENGCVKVRIYGDYGDIRIDTTDNGVGFREQGEIYFPLETKVGNKTNNHVGLNNAHNIIRLMYGEKYGIQAFSKKGEGTTVSIRIPRDTIK